jgi:serine/threonine-protein kinase
VLPEDQIFTALTRHALAISPDSTKLVYVANGQLFLRQMAEMEARPIPGASRGVSNPFFSPDSQWVGFWSDGTLKKIAVTGGPAITICKSGGPFGASWDDGHIVFAGPAKGILRVPDNGGEVELLLKVDYPDFAQSPQMLDHGRSVLFSLANGIDFDRWDRAQIVVQSLSSAERKVVVRGGSDARYVSSGHIIYASSGNIMAVPFDLKKLEVKGRPVAAIEGVLKAFTLSQTAAANLTGAAQFSISANGALVYIPGFPAARQARTPE